MRDIAFPVRNGARGRVYWVAGVTVDAGERHGAEGLRRRRLGELNHRVRNALASVQSLAAQTVRAVPEPSAFWATFAGRLFALARTHDRLSERGWAAGAESRGLLDVEPAPYLGTGGPGAGPSATLDGLAVHLDAEAAVTLALGLDELATSVVATLRACRTRPACTACRLFFTRWWTSATRRSRSGVGVACTVGPASGAAMSPTALPSPKVVPGWPHMALVWLRSCRPPHHTEP